MLLVACQSNPPMPTVEHVELERFMGEWYVIANIPTALERGAHNAIEAYRLDEDGSIATRFTFRKDSFDGPLKEYEPRGFVRNTQTNAEWGMQFVWPVKADYRIVWLDEAYSITAIGRNKRDYLWIMAREPSISEAEYREILQFVDSQGYDIDLIERVPQRWPES